MKMNYKMVEGLEKAIEACVNTGRGMYWLREQCWIEAVWEEVRSGAYMVKVYWFLNGLPVVAMWIEETLTTNY